MQWCFFTLYSSTIHISNIQIYPSDSIILIRSYLLWERINWNAFPDFKGDISSYQRHLYTSLFIFVWIILSRVGKRFISHTHCSIIYTQNSSILVTLGCLLVFFIKNSVITTLLTKVKTLTLSYNRWSSYGDKQNNQFR